MSSSDQKQDIGMQLKLDIIFNIFAKTCTSNCDNFDEAHVKNFGSDYRQKIS